ncbi:aminodeoxychorismate lyase [Neobacillus sp. SM06]|uniref:aminodeoxychorismate lyase n=1 Tax=Neobacillus sp. SM06 TaxID=3422492 RepID=UPI003D2B804C
MKFNKMSSFAAGIFLSTSIIGGVYFFGNDKAAKADPKSTAKQSNAAVQLSEGQMKDKLAVAGYIVQKKDEYNNNLKKAAQSGKKDTTSADPSSQKVVYKAVINVADGMTSIDVGNALQKANIIQNAFNFSKDIESRGLQNNLRPGTFVVDSEMSYDQVIATIFKK